MKCAAEEIAEARGREGRREDMYLPITSWILDFEFLCRRGQQRTRYASNGKARN
jgi:hypothetical protein